MTYSRENLASIACKKDDEWTRILSQANQESCIREKAKMDIIELSTFFLFFPMTLTM